MLWPTAGPQLAHSWPQLFMETYLYLFQKQEPVCHNLHANTKACFKKHLIRFLPADRRAVHDSLQCANVHHTRAKLKEVHTLGLFHLPPQLDEGVPLSAKSFHSLCRLAVISLSEQYSLILPMFIRTSDQ